MFDVVPQGKAEKETNRQGRLSERQKRILKVRFWLAGGVFLLFLLVSLPAFIWIAAHGNASGAVVTWVAIFGPGSALISGWFAVVNLLILRKAKIVQRWGHIQRKKIRYVGGGRYRQVWYQYWIVVGDIAVPIDEIAYAGVEEGHGTVYYLSTPIIQNQFLFADY